MNLLIDIERQAEEAQRDDCTILVNRLPLHADEKSIYMFFAKDKGVGKIRDVRLIRDQRSGKSKGYVMRNQDIIPPLRLHQSHMLTLC